MPTFGDSNARNIPLYVIPRKADIAYKCGLSKGASYRVVNAHDAFTPHASTGSLRRCEMKRRDMQAISAKEVQRSAKKLRK
jgi:hypothetical protein